jgi:hypothetical protein
MRFSTAADIAKLPIREKRYDALDSVFAGLRVRVTPNGAKSFSYLFRVKGERAKRRITLGPVGKLDLASARKLAREAQVEAVRGAIRLRSTGSGAGRSWPPRRSARSASCSPSTWMTPRDASRRPR